jgi:antitoxin (DNA-binding transcriptional repressor) of toxin-antitoxin stability system
MKTIEIQESDAIFGEYLQAGEIVVLTRSGQPVAAVVPIEGMDLETLSLSTNPKFLEIIERSRRSQKEHGRISLESVEQQFGL